jgi:ribonucleoside-diphosphate reductase alpha chain
VKVNKAEEIGSGARKGFGAAVPAGAADLAAAEVAAPAAAPRKGFGFGGLAPKTEG